MSKTIAELTAELEATKKAMKELKQANRPKTPVTMSLHTAKDSGKLSIKVNQGFRSAYLNAEQLLFILANSEQVIALTKSL